VHSNGVDAEQDCIRFRVLADAKMGVSKHQILLAARAARNTQQSEEAVGSGEHEREEETDDL